MQTPSYTPKSSPTQSHSHTARPNALLGNVLMIPTFPPHSQLLKGKSIYYQTPPSSSRSVAKPINPLATSIIARCPRANLVLLTMRGSSESLACHRCRWRTRSMDSGALSKSSSSSNGFILSDSRSLYTLYQVLPCTYIKIQHAINSIVQINCINFHALKFLNLQNSCISILREIEEGNEQKQKQLRQVLLSV